MVRTIGPLSSTGREYFDSLLAFPNTPMVNSLAPVHPAQSGAVLWMVNTISPQ
jgi:hypothetical protein